MKLIDEIKDLESGTKIRVKLKDNSTLTGEYETYTSAINNDPPITSIDLRTEEGIYELYEDEIKSIEKI